MEDNSDYECQECGASFERRVKIAAHVAAHQRSISPETIIQELQRVAEELGRTPKQPEISAKTEFTYGAVSSTFGGWPEGLKAAGLEPLSHSITVRDIIEELQHVASTIGHSPSVSEMQEHGEIAPSTVKNHFGGWTNGLEAAGLKTSFSRKIPKPEVISAIKSLAQRLGREPGSAEMDRMGEVSARVAQDRYGSWNEALRAAGLQPRSEKNISETRLLDEIHRLAAELGHPPSSVDLAKFGQHAVPTYTRRFGTWRAAIEAAGLQYRPEKRPKVPSGWDGRISDISYGPNWETQRERTIERDDSRCQMPSCMIDRRQHRDLFDQDIHIHHIIPIRTFIREDGSIEYERANKLDNLVSLYRRHHLYWEQLSPLRPDIR